MIALRTTKRPKGRASVGVVVALAAVIGPVGWNRVHEGRGAAHGRRVKGLDFTLSGASTAIPGPIPVASVVGAPTPLGAAQQLADAVVAGDIEAAYGLLTTQDRTRLGSAQQFGAELARQAHWETATARADGSAVVIDVTREPALDEALGLVTAHASVAVPAVQQDGSWFVDWGHRRISAKQTLTDSGVAADVTTWVRVRQSCRFDPTLEYEQGVAGVAGYAETLCHTTATPALAAPTGLDVLEDPAPFIDAFGPGVLSWGRVVALQAPIATQIVVAPVGDRWLVIGLARPNSVSNRDSATALS